MIADGQGTAWAVGVRDCSCQRRNQKVIEESASPALTAEQEREVREAAQRLALRAGYRNAGTVEFLYEPGDAPLLVHGGQRPPAGRAPRDRGGHRARPGEAAAARRRGRAARGRAAAAGRARDRGAAERRGRRRSASRPPPGASRCCGCRPARAARRHRRRRGRRHPGRVRLDDRQGDRVGPRPRRGARSPAARARRHDGGVDGGTTNQGFLLELLDRPEVRAGEVDTTWLDRLQLRGDIVPVRHADVALLQAAIEISRGRDGGRPRALLRVRPPRPPAGRRRHRAHRRPAPPRAGVPLRGRPDRPRPPSRDRRRRDSRGRRAPRRPLRAAARARRRHLPTVVSVQGADLLVEVDGVPHRISRDDGGLVRNLAPAVVVSIPVAPGDEVEAGDVVAVVESMKMETSLVAPFRGRVRGAGEPERARRRAGAAAAARAARRRRRAGAATATDLVRGAGEPARRAAALPREPERLEWPCSATTSMTTRSSGSSPTCTASAPTAARDPELIPGEHRLLALYADLAALTRPRHDESRGRERLSRSPQEHLYACLRSLDAEAEGLRPLRRAAAPRARPLRNREPRPHAGARGGLLPAVPLPAARRSGTRRRAGDPRPSARAGRRRSPGSRPGLPRGARPAGRGDRRAATRSSPTSPARCASAASTRRSSRRPATRLRRRWTPPRGAGARTPGAPTATSGWPRSSPARARWRRC